MIGVVIAAIAIPIVLTPVAVLYPRLLIWLLAAGFVVEIGLWTVAVLRM